VSASAQSCPAFPGTPWWNEQADPPGPANQRLADDYTLVERAQGGDAAAFGDLYDRHVTAIYRYIYFRVGNRQVAEDLTSETFTKALAALGRYRWRKPVGAWLMTIARNLVFDHYRARRRRPETLRINNLYDRSLDDAAGTQPDCGDTVADRGTLVAAIRQLTPKQQECVTLRFLMDLSATETAAAMGRSRVSVSILTHRALARLASLLPPDTGNQKSGERP
jgi:RNA polymerase sigma-70 factor (ECF subfamily)